MKFYVVGTPIGNLEDLTFRARRILSEVDLILCEDTRVTRHLLNKYEIKTETLSYHSQSKLSKIDKIIELIRGGKTLALVSDAGTPAISDPGSFLLAKLRHSLPEIEVVAIPGVSALTTAVSIAGLPINEFTFLGFLPHKKGRETLFREIANTDRAYIFYESPHRIIKTLESLVEYAPSKIIGLGRELTKIYEQMLLGHPAEILKYFQDNPDKIRGEFVVIVS